MSDPTSRAARTAPCTVTWCDAAAHPADEANHHFAGVATFPGVDGSDTQVLIVQAGPSGRDLPDPHIVLRRSAGTLWAQLDFVPGEALILAEIFAAIDPADMVRIAAALATAAAVIDPDEEAGE
ncbi:MAG: hypothetical protein JWN52_7219 [Actinomycetia bacterium]|nr:hypothetical protein [Actinomycetes bacterium]